MTAPRPASSLPEPPQKPPEAWSPLLELAAWTKGPVDRFLQIQASSGIVLLASAVIALVWANSPWSASYLALWHTPLGVRIGSFVFERSLEWFINDVLMVVFFFVVGMEIRREIHSGELSDVRRALLPAVAALGGMVAPALVYLAVAGDEATRSGWGVPTATDIAFAVGVLALLGPRVPPALRVLLLALAVIDDLGAIVVIALFYSSGVDASGLSIAALGVAGIFALQKFGVRNKLVYLLPGFVTWAGTYAAGVHPTIAGVVVGLCTPVRAWFGAEGFAREVSAPLERLRADDAPEMAEVLARVRLAQREAISPIDALVGTLHPWVAYFIMPLFALANAGVVVSGVEFDVPATNAALGAGLGLVLGKPLGVTLACALVLRLGVARLPVGLGPRHLLTLGLVAGIGFTMALFVAQLAFTDARLLGAAKLGVLTGSAVAGVLGVAVGSWLLRPLPEGVGARTATEAETSTEL